MKKLVTVRQLTLMLIVSMFALKVLVLPNLLAKEFSRDGYAFVTFMLLLDIGILCIFLFLRNRYREMNFYGMMKHLFGKVIAKIIIFLFLLYFIAKSSAIFEANFIYLNENLYTSFTWPTFTVPFLIVLLLIGFQGMNALARTVEFFFLIIIIGLISSIGMGLMTADFTNLLPFFENGLVGFENVFKFTFWFGDYLFIIVMFGNIKEEKKMNLKIIISVLVASLLIALVHAVFYACYNHSVANHTNAISDLIQVSQSISDINSLDWILILIWDMVLFLTFSLNLLGAFYCFRHSLFKFHEALTLSLLLISVFLINYLTNFDFYYGIEFAEKILPPFCIAIQYGLPLLIFVVSLFKGGKKNEIPVAK